MNKETIIKILKKIFSEYESIKDFKYDMKEKRIIIELEPYDKYSQMKGM